MARLLYVANTSVDGYVEDEQGGIDWAAPNDEVFAFLTDLVRPVGTHLCGRRMYEAMAVWETDPGMAEQSALMADFARLWQELDKVVYSTTLDAVPTARTRIERRFDPDAVRATKAAAAANLLVGGADLAGQALAAGVVDEVHLVVRPIAIGGGTPALPLGIRLDLDLLRATEVADGVVHLRYGVR